MRLPVGAERTIYLDWETPVDVDDYIQTSRQHTYLVLESRLLERGPMAGRRRCVRVMVVPAQSIEPGAKVHGMYWPRS